MLKGTISHCGHKYEVRGKDNSTVMSLRLSSPLYKSLNYLGSEDDNCDDYQLTERSCNIGLSSVTVETMQLVGDNGKAKKAPINELFFCKLGALISYAKSHCFSRYSDTYSDLVSADGEFDISPLVRYKVPFPSNSEFKGVFAEVSMYYGCVQSLKIDCNGFEIELHEDHSYVEVLPAIKNGQKKGFKYSESLLGFDAEDNIPEFVSTTGMYMTIEEVIAAHPEKNLDWLSDADYKIVTDETLDSVCEYIKGHDGYVYYDTETTGLNINFKSRIGQADQCVGIILSVKYGESFFFPMQMKNIENLCGGDHFYFMEHYMREILESKKLVAHNMTFDWKVGYIYNINCNIVMDTMAIIKLTIGAERDSYPMGLKDNAKLLLGRDSLELSDFIVDNSWGETDIKFWDLPANLVRLYACADTDNTQGIMEWAIRNDIVAKYNASKVLEIEIAFSFAVAYQEFYGHLVDINNLAEVRKQVGAEQEKYMKLMVNIVGHEFNPNSSPQLIKIMYGELGIPEQISRKTGRPTTDKETLGKLAEITDLEDNIKYPFCSYLKKYREAEGVRKIVDKFPELMTNDGYLFSSVMQYGTTTGRVSINNPNYQSYNDPVKKNVIPRPGFYMFDTDYSSVEYRVLGNMVGNKKIMENFKDPDFDYHAYQAAHMYGVPYSAVTKKLRKAAKGINFGLPYGMGDESLGVRVFGEASEENTRKAAGLRSAYFKGQEDIRDWFEYHRTRGVQLGYTETYFGRRRYYHRDKYSDNAIRRQAGNHVIQGSAADIYKTAVGRMFKRICREGLLGKVLFPGFIHDELLVEVSEDINPAQWLKLAREEFEVKITNEDGSPWSPLYMGCGFGTSWYEAKSVELPIKLQWELVEKYGEQGYPDWDGNGRHFCDKIPDILRDFEVRDIRNQLLDTDSQGKEIKPTLNNQIFAMCKDDSQILPDATSKYLQTKDIVAVLDEADYLRYLDENYHIQSVPRDDAGNFVISFSPAKETQSAIDQYCLYHSTDRSKIDIHNIEEVSASEAKSGDVESFTGFDDDGDLDDATKKLIAIDKRVTNFGMYADPYEKVLYLKNLGMGAHMSVIRGRCTEVDDGTGYSLRFRVDMPDGTSQYLQTTKPLYIPYKEINFIQGVYIDYFKKVGQRG